MKIFKDYSKKEIRLTTERMEHIQNDHPEMKDQLERINDTLLNPEYVIKSNTDELAQLHYKLYKNTPVTSKYLCVLVKNLVKDSFIITAYFTDSVKKGEMVWQKE